MKLFNKWPVPKPKILIALVFRVIAFDRNGTTIDSSGNVNAKYKFKPYGYLTVESPHFKEGIKIPIIHRDDFLLATFFFDDKLLVEAKENNEVELLVTYYPSDSDKNGFSQSIFHCLHYAVCSYNTMEDFYTSSNPDPEKIFGKITFTGELSIKDNL